MCQHLLEMHGPPFAKGKSKIHAGKRVKLGALGKEGLQVRSSVAGGLWPGLGAAAALLQAIAREGGAKVGGPGLLLHAFQTLRKAVAGRWLLRNQVDSFTTLQCPLMPAFKNEDGCLHAP